MKGQMATEHPSGLHEPLMNGGWMLDAGFSDMVKDPSKIDVIAGRFSTINGLGDLFENNDAEVKGLKAPYCQTALFYRSLRMRKT